MRTESPGGLGDVHHQIGTALQLVGDTQRGRHEPHISCVELAIAEEREALVLDGVPHRVDGVVVVDDPLCLREVGGEQGIGSGGNRVGRERCQPNDSERQLAELCVDGHHLHGSIIGRARTRLASPFRLFARCSPSRHNAATASLRAIRTIRLR